MRWAATPLDECLLDLNEMCILPWYVTESEWDFRLV